MRAAVLTAVATLACAGVATAGDLPPDAVARRLTQAPLEQPVSPARGVQVTTEQGDTSVAFRYGWSTASGEGFGTKNSIAVFETYALTASGPLADSGDSELANLDALASGFTFEAKYTQSKATRAHAANGEAMLATCDAVKARQIAEARKKLDVPEASEEEQADVRAQVRAEVAEITKKTCSMNFIDLNGTPEDFKSFKALLWGERPMATIWGASARVGRSTFDFFDPTTLAKGSTDKEVWSVKGFWAYRPLDGDWLVTLSAEHQDAYEAADADILCPTGSGIVTCVNGAIGAPKRLRRDVLSVEYRRAFTGFSAAAVLQYDANNGVSAIDVPIYLVRDKDGKLNGGVKLGWRSDKGDVTAGVFIGTAFGLGAPN